MFIGGEKNMKQLKDYLLNTCNDMYNVACANCKADYVDEDSCFWYHSVWQYLRVLNCVSSPEWHLQFYVGAIKEYVKLNNKSFLNILISGCADNSMLYVVVIAISEIMKERPDLTGKIVAVDLCDTPLLICKKWWSKEKEENQKKNDPYSIVFQNISFSTVTKDICKYSDSNFDLIVTDAFLTRFQKDSASNLLEHWGSLLNGHGQVITTVRIHEKTRISRNERCRQIDDFVKKILKRYNQGKCQKQFDINASQLEYKARVYAVKMTSYSWGNMAEIEELLKQYFNIIEHSTFDTPGELEHTVYGHYVLEKCK